jgi:hypothetical protein
MNNDNSPTRRKKLATKRRPFASEFGEWTDAQKDQYVQQYEREIPRSERTTPTLQEARRHANAMKKLRGPGRPKLGGVGTKSVLITIEPKLLKRADAYAREHRLSRSALFARGVEMALTS